MADPVQATTDGLTTQQAETCRAIGFRDGYAEGQFVLSGELAMLRTLAEQMTEFVQFVADHTHDPAALAKEAKRHGAR